MGYVKSMKNKKVFFLTAVWGLKQSGYAKSLNMCSKYLTVVQSRPIIYTTDYGIAGLPCMWLKNLIYAKCDLHLGCSWLLFNGLSPQTKHQKYLQLEMYHITAWVVIIKG